MSAAATAAGYLYASGRLRGRGSREETQEEGAQHSGSRARDLKDRPVKVAVYHPEAASTAGEDVPAAAPRKPAHTPKIQYKTRRWKPE